MLSSAKVCEPFSPGGRHRSERRSRNGIEAVDLARRLVPYVVLTDIATDAVSMRPAPFSGVAGTRVILTV